jgi:putative ABC transport system permease protein
MTLSIAIKNLLQDKIRVLLSATGVALAVMLILILNGFVSGLYQQVSAYLDNSPGSLIITQDGVTNMLGATSLIPVDTKDRVLESQAVAELIPILSQFVILDLHDLKQPAYLIGYPGGSGSPASRGGPWNIIQGREPLSNDEMVFDQVLAKRHNLKLGDRFNLMGQEFRIVGLSDDTTSWMTSFIFLRKTAVEELLRAPNMTSFLLVSKKSGFDQAQVINQLLELEGIEVLTKETIVANDTKLLVEVFSTPLQLMAAIAFFVGVLVVGLVIYTATIERQREYGVLKSIGAQNRFLYKLVIIQASIAAALGSIAGIGLALGLSQSIMYFRPEFLILFEPNLVWLALVSGFGISLLAAIVPARTVAKLEPAIVFQRGN